MKRDTMSNLKIEIDVENLRKNRIFVATPMYGGSCYATYANSMFNMFKMGTAHGIDIDTFIMTNESLIQRARNYCVDKFLQSDCEHLLFIDADIGFNPQDVFAMAHLQDTFEDFDVVCGPYQKKSIRWENVKKAVEQGYADSDANMLSHFVGDYVFNIDSSTLKDGGFKLNEPVQVMESGTGFMMIRRSVFTKILENMPEILYTPDHLNSDEFDGSRKIGAYFDCLIDPDTNRYLSEDFLFCKRVRDNGMKVWLFPWISLNHTGTTIFGGTLGALAAINVTPTFDISKEKKKKEKE